MHSFTHADPKNAKRHWWLDCLFALLGSVCVKAACKMLVKLTPDGWKVEMKSNSDKTKCHGAAELVRYNRVGMWSKNDHLGLKILFFHCK